MNQGQRITERMKRLRDLENEVVRAVRQPEHVAPDPFAIEVFPAKITGVDADDYPGVYAFSELEWDAVNLEWAVKTGGRSGALDDGPARELRDLPAVPVNSFVHIAESNDSTSGTQYSFLYEIETFWSLIGDTDVDESPGMYAFVEQELGVDGETWQTVSGGRSGTLLSNPAREANGLVSVPSGTRVMMRMEFDANDVLRYVFEYGGSSSSFWARIGETSEGSPGRYAFVEQQIDEDGETWETKPGGRTGALDGNPAREANGVADVPSGTYVLMSEEIDEAGETRYIFEYSTTTRKTFWARIGETSEGSPGRYAFVEQQIDEDGETFEALVGGRSEAIDGGNPAIESNGVTDVAEDTIVLMTEEVDEAGETRYVFEYGSDPYPLLAIFDGYRWQTNGSQADPADVGYVYTGHLVDESDGSQGTAIQWKFLDDDGDCCLLDASELCWILREIPAYMEDDADWKDTGTYGARYLAQARTRVTRRVFKIYSVQPDYLVCYGYDFATDTLDGSTTLVAKPWLLQKTPFNGETIDGLTYGNYSSTGTSRTVTAADESQENQVVIPPYRTSGDGDVIVAERRTRGGTGVLYSGEYLVWQDTNQGGRAWAEGEY